MTNVVKTALIRGASSSYFVFPKNNNLFFALFFMMLFFILLLVAYPRFFLSMFRSFFGIFGLIFFVCLVGLVDLRWAVGIGMFFIIIYLTLLPTGFLYHSGSRENNISEKKEGFRSQENVIMNMSGHVGWNRSGYGHVNGNGNGNGNGKENENRNVWPQETIDAFNKFEKTHNPNYIFDINVIQQQATPADVEYLIQNNKWFWSSEVQQMYIDALKQNIITSYDSESSLAYAQTIYNENAIKQLLSWNTKEGNFLLNGAVIGHSKNMPKNVNNIVKCYIPQNDSYSNHKDNQESTPHKVVYDGYNSIYGNMNKEVTPISNEEIPKLVSGFQFLKEPCNPCVALNSPAQYNCPFALNTGNGYEVSSVWNNLWGLSDYVKNIDSLIKLPLLSGDNTNSTYINADYFNSNVGVIPISFVAQHVGPPLPNTPTNFN